jgi:uncharacterized protein YdcH (DUF465 family)
MNINKNLLKQIIMEELNSVIEEMKMKYPSGHPDHQHLRNIRRGEGGIDSDTIAAIQNLEKTDPKMAKELARSIGSKENFETMPDSIETKNVMALKSEILELHGIISDKIFFAMAEGEDINWKEITPLRKKRDELEDELIKITKESGSDLEDWRNKTDSDRKRKLRGIGYEFKR